MPPRPQLTIPSPGGRRAVVLGAGSFGTAVAVLLARGGFRTTLQTRTTEQAERLEADRENKRVPARASQLPRELRVEPMSAGLSRADYVFLGVPSKGIAAGHREPAQERATGAHAGDLDGEGPRSRRTASRPRRCSTRCAAWTASGVSEARRTRARWSPRAPGWSPPPPMCGSRPPSRTVFMRVAWCASSPTTRSASSSPASPRTPRRSPRAPRRSRA